MRKNGSITVYMSLVFSVILTLIAGSLQSVRMAYARVLTASAAEQGLYSIFSRFDRKLLEEYELFFLDGGCGTGEWQPGNLYQTAEDTASWILGEGNQILDGFSSGLKLENGSITSYILATDGVEGDYGIVSLRSVNDPEDDYPSKLKKKRFSRI